MPIIKSFQLAMSVKGKWWIYSSSKVFIKGCGKTCKICSISVWDYSATWEPF